jgi:hypothetical protein
MGALTIAFDTIIVGALALPWVYLVIHIFFFEGENRIEKLLKWVKDKKAKVPAGVLLFAVTYTLGSSIERVAQDFLNDDDLRIPHVFFMAWTENRIIASVYCDSDNGLLQPTSAESAALVAELQQLQSQSTCCKPQARCTDSPLAVRQQKQPCACDSILRAFRQHVYFNGRNKEEEDLKDLTWNIFGLEENALLLRGEDDTLRLRQLHDQIMVLRGAAFNCLISFSLCIFAWCVRVRREKPHWKWRWVPACVPGVFLLFAGLALYHHLVVEHDFARPPYMEFSLVAIGGVGAFLLWFKGERSQAEDARAEKAQSAETQPGNTKPSGPSDPNENDDCFLRWKWGMLSFVFAFLFAAGVLGWWATEVLYVQQVIYSYNSQPPADTTNNK